MYLLSYVFALCEITQMTPVRSGSALLNLQVLDLVCGIVVTLH